MFEAKAVSFVSVIFESSSDFACDSISLRRLLFSVFCFFLLLDSLDATDLVFTSVVEVGAAGVTKLITDISFSDSFHPFFTLAVFFDGLGVLVDCGETCGCGGGWRGGCGGREVTVSVFSSFISLL